LQAAEVLDAVAAAGPGSAKGLYLIVSDIEAARAELLARGFEVSEAFHDAGDAHAGADEPYLFGRIRVAGPDSEHRSYRSFASFSDPDGKGWLLQEITARLPGRVDTQGTTFASATELAMALLPRRVLQARTGRCDGCLRNGTADVAAGIQSRKAPSVRPRTI
jgi:hypothetical protein